MENSHFKLHLACFFLLQTRNIKNKGFSKESIVPFYYFIITFTRERVKNIQSKFKNILLKKLILVFPFLSNYENPYHTSVKSAKRYTGTICNMILNCCITFTKMIEKNAYLYLSIL
jgi:hypothetical protein